MAGADRRSNTLSVCWFYTRVPREREPYVQGPIPTWHGPIKDAQGQWISSHVINQDIIAWVGQGIIADRSHEHLGASDLGIVMIRKRFLEALAALGRGAEPKGIIRNPNVARCVELPNMERQRCVEGVTLADFATIPILKARLQSFRWQYGQPPEVRRAFEQAMGINSGTAGLTGGKNPVRCRSRPDGRRPPEAYSSAHLRRSSESLAAETFVCQRCVCGPSVCEPSF
jgi:5,5'-dehydrodivanillate O-demethylase